MEKIGAFWHFLSGSLEKRAGQGEAWSDLFIVAPPDGAADDLDLVHKGLIIVIQDDIGITAVVGAHDEPARLHHQTLDIKGVIVADGIIMWPKTFIWPGSP